MTPPNDPLQARIDGLTGRAREALAVAGCLGLAPFQREPIAAALKLGPRKTGRALDELVEAGLLRRLGDHYVAADAGVLAWAREEAGKRRPAGSLARLAAYLTDLCNEHGATGGRGPTSLDPERDHLLAVIGRCVAAELWQAAVSLVDAAFVFLDRPDRSAEQHVSLELGIQAARASGDRESEAKFLNWLGVTCASPELAIELFQQSLAVARESGAAATPDSEEWAAARLTEEAALGNLGIAYRDLGQVARAVEYTEQSLVVAREIGDRGCEGAALNNLGLIYRDAGQVERARDCLRQALAIYEEVKSPHADLIRKWLVELDADERPAADLPGRSSSMGKRP